MTAKKAKIKKLVTAMLKESNKKAIENIERVLNSGCIDVDAWDENSNPMILPRSITVALLNHEAEQNNAGGTSFEKEVKKNVKNIGYFL